MRNKSLCWSCKLPEFSTGWLKILARGSTRMLLCSFALGTSCFGWASSDAMGVHAALRLAMSSGLATLPSEATAQANRLAQAAQPKYSLSLAQAVHMSLEQNRAIKSSELDRTLQRIDLQLAENEQLPKLGVSSQWSRSFSNGSITQTAELKATPSLKMITGTSIDAVVSKPVLSSDSAATRAVTFAINVVQPLLKGNASVAGLALQSARLNQSIAQMQHDLLIENTIASVVLAYYAAVQADVQIELARQGVQRNLDVKKINQSLFDAGRLAQVELLQADVDIAQNELALRQAINNAEQAKRALLHLLGSAGEAIAVDALLLSDKVPEDDEYPSVEQAIKLANELRQDVQVARLSQKIASFGIRQADNNLLPQLDLVLGRTSASSAGTTVATSAAAYTVGLNFSTNWDRSTEYAQQSRAKAAATKAQWALEDLEQAITTDVKAAVLNLEFTRTKLSLGRQVLDIARRRLANEIDKFRAGRTSSFQLSSVQDAFKSAETAVGEATLEKLRMRLELHKIIGQVRQVWASAKLPPTPPTNSHSVRP